MSRYYTRAKKQNCYTSIIYLFIYFLIHLQFVKYSYNKKMNGVYIVGKDGHEFKTLYIGNIKLMY